MAIKQVAYSDITNEPIPDEQHARIQVKHPDTSWLVELDVSTDEASKLVNTTLRLLEFTIFEPNQPPRRALVETKTVDALFKGINFDAILDNGRRVDTPSTPPSQRVRTASAPKAASSGEKRDYSSVQWAGSVKRGKTSDAEKATVKANLDEVNNNLAARGERTIDPRNPEHKEKYGL